MERKLYAVGDIHGKFDTLEKTLSWRKDSDFILVGDIYLGFHSKEVYKYWLPQFNEKLKANNNTIYLMRGNHDDPSFWKENKINLSNIKLVQDYEVLYLKNKNILCIGGAISIDRNHRIEGKTYWKDEEFVYDENKLMSFKDIHIVITHTAPDFCKPQGYDNDLLKSFYFGDPELRGDLMGERAVLSRVHSVLTRGDLFNKPNDIYQWYYGHFHKRYQEAIHDIYFRCCNILEVVEIN